MPTPREQKVKPKKEIGDHYGYQIEEGSGAVDRRWHCRQDKDRL